MLAKKKEEKERKIKTNSKPTDKNNKYPISSHTWHEKERKLKTAITLRIKTAKALLRELYAQKCHFDN